MATILQEKMKSRAAIVSALESIIETADREGRDITQAESERFETLDAELDRMEDEIREFKKGKRKGEHNMSVTTSNREFRNLGELLYTVAVNNKDPRLAELRATQQVGQGALGGYMVTEQISQDIQAVKPDEAVVRPRATVFPPGNVPDAPLKIPALDQGSDSNRWGNFQVYHSGELKTLTESNINLRMITLTPHKMTGYMRVSNELLRNWRASNEFLIRQMRLSMIAAEDTDFLSGNGVDKAKGVLNSGATITVSRESANQISYTDIVNMMARAKMGGNLVWVASQTAIGQLANLRDSGNNNLWIQSSVRGLPQSLMGYPVIFCERSQPLGSAGDLMLCDFSYYLIKNGSGPLISLSEHVHFTTDEMDFRIIWYVDGASGLEEPIPLEGSTTNTVSPFVVLGA